MKQAAPTAYPLTHAQATAVLACKAVTSAHLVDAVLTAVDVFAERAARQYGIAKRWRVLFSRIEGVRVYFALFQGEQRLQLFVYEYDSDKMLGPRLRPTDVVGTPLPPCALTRQLQPLLDMALAGMERQVWARVPATTLSHSNARQAKEV